jgi:hypothetical protein
MADAELIARVDAARLVLGQTRRVFVERALERELARLRDATKRPDALP